VQVTEYTFSIVRELLAEEIADLEADANASLSQLTARYFSNYDLDEDFPATAQQLDILRGSWLIDKSADRPEYQHVVASAGFAFGRLLQREHGLKWALIEDPYGRSISMVRERGEHDPVSIPPFSYVEKREDTQNVEVFQHFFEQVPAEYLAHPK